MIRPWTWPGRLGVGLCIGIIRVYQKTLSRLIGPTCRFHPSCSCYAVEALQKYGLVRGLAKGVWRICRCNPFNPGGYDPP
jgi:putative membrane protein insertion efficiency factor